MSSPNFCSNCREKLDTDSDVEKCPKCQPLTLLT